MCESGTHRGRVRHAPRASQARTAGESDVHCTRTTGEPDVHRACTRLIWAMELMQMGAESYFGI